MFTKEQVEILWTKDYDDFSFYDKNREIDYRHCEKKIQESLVNNGWLKDFPMVVDEQLRIRDGQHRFMVAKDMGISIPFKIVKNFNDEQMFDINNANKRWTQKDFLHYHMMKGDKNAKILYDLIKEYKLSIRFALGLIHLSHAVINLPDVTFRDLDKKDLVRKINLINEITDIVKISSERIKISLIPVIEHPKYNHKRMLSKLSYQLDKVHVHTTAGHYISMWQDIYNYKTNDKVFFK